MRCRCRAVVRWREVASGGRGGVRTRQVLYSARLACGTPGRTAATPLPALAARGIRLWYLPSRDRNRMLAGISPDGPHTGVSRGTLTGIGLLAATAHSAFRSAHKQLPGELTAAFEDAGRRACTSEAEDRCETFTGNGGRLRAVRWGTCPACLWMPPNCWRPRPLRCGERPAPHPGRAVTGG